jgi:hypothetical protein
VRKVSLKLVDEQDPSIPYVDHGGHLHLYLQTTGVAAIASQLKAIGLSLASIVHRRVSG